MLKNIALLSLVLLSSTVWGQNQLRPNGAFGTADKMGYLYSTVFRNEIEASSTFGELSIAKSTVFTASVDYKYLIRKAMQAGARVDIAMYNGNGNNNTYMGLWGTFTYNFNQSWNVSDSWFAEIALGLVDTALAPQPLAGGVKSEKKFSTMGLVGKRIPLFRQISFLPEAGLRKIGDMDMEVLVIPINLAIAW